MNDKMKKQRMLASSRWKWKPKDILVKGQTSTVTGNDVFSGEPFTISVPTHGLMKYCEGAAIQEAFPYSTADDRELILSGITPGSWNMIFS